jgi:HPt (histidine-containing phosphotransfer) domain-containing protein
MESDLINLEELKNLYGDDSTKELLEMSMKEGRGLIDALKKSVPAHDAASVSADAHQLKGMSATMTMGKVADLSYKLELSSKSQTWQDCENLIKEIDSSFAAVEEYLRKKLA